MVTRTADIQEPRFAITGRKLFVLVTNLTAQDNANLLQQLKTSFRREINWNKYQ